MLRRPIKSIDDTLFGREQKVKNCWDQWCRSKGWKRTPNSFDLPKIWQNLKKCGQKSF